MEPSLQRLRVSGGWTIVWNNFVDINLSAISDEDSYTFLGEDLLYARHENFNRILDVGWYGDLNEGTYGMVVYEGDFHGKLLFELRTRDQRLLVEQIDQWMAKVSNQEA